MHFASYLTVLAASSALLVVDASSPGGYGGYGSYSNNYGAQQQQQQSGNWQQQSKEGQVGNYGSAEQPGSSSEAPALSERLPPLPPGWTEHMDPGSGQPYYYNAELGTSSWDRPMPEEGEPEVIEPAETDTTYGVNATEDSAAQPEEPSANEYGHQQQPDKREMDPTETLPTGYSRSEESVRAEAQRYASQGWGGVKENPGEPRRSDAGGPGGERIESPQQQQQWRPSGGPRSDAGWGLDDRQREQPKQQGFEPDSKATEALKERVYNPQSGEQAKPQMQESRSQNTFAGHSPDLPRPTESQVVPEAKSQWQQPSNQSMQNPAESGATVSAATKPGENHGRPDEQAWKSSDAYRGPQETPPRSVDAPTVAQQARWQQGFGQPGTDAPQLKAQGQQPQNQQPPSVQQNPQKTSPPQQEQAPPQGWQPESQQHREISQDPYRQQGRPDQQAGGPYGGPAGGRPNPSQQYPYGSPYGQYGQPPPQQQYGQQPPQQQYGSQTTAQQQQYGATGSQQQPQQGYYRQPGGGQLVPQSQSQTAEQPSAVKEALGSAWQGILGFRNRTKEVVESATNTVVSQAKEATQTITATSTNLWGQARNSLGSVFENNDQAAEYSLTGRYGSTQSGSTQSGNSGQGYPQNYGYPPGQQLPPGYQQQQPPPGYQQQQQPPPGYQQQPPQNRYPPGYSPPQARTDPAYPPQQQQQGPQPGGQPPLQAQWGQRQQQQRGAPPQQDPNRRFGTGPHGQQQQTPHGQQRPPAFNKQSQPRPKPQQPSAKEDPWQHPGLGPDGY